MFLLIITSVTLLSQVLATTFIPPCDSFIFCQGEILEKVQMARVFHDSKTFVDMPLKTNESVVLSILRSKLHQNLTKEQMKALVDEYFLPTGTELENVTPVDWKSDPAIFKKIKDPEYREFARRIHDVWKILNRQMIQEVKGNSRYSLIYSTNPFVVPGGRFREFYYWDTYWVVGGLLLSDMAETVKGMILNFVDLIKEYGFIPNGGRVYYRNRSQPPFITLMVREYYKATKDVQLVKNVVKYLETEYQFWMQNRSVTLDQRHGFQVQHTVNRFAAPMGYPRPESYYEDVDTVRKAGLQNDNSEKMNLYAHIASAAESGWDFSSRWFSETGPHSFKMASIRTRNIIPVGLNSILCAVERTLGEFFSLLGDVTKAKKYQDAFQKRKRAVNEVFWNDAAGQWLDYDYERKSRRGYFYASNMYPLWAGCYDLNATRANIVINSLKRQGIFNFPGGIPTSLNHTEQQWDFPNAWPPLQDIMEAALRDTGLPEGKEQAFQLAKKWLETNFISWKQTGHMYEKYDVNIRGKPGHGGEYDVQVGFGWTNGVVLKFLDRYGDKLVAPEISGGKRVLPLWILSTLLFVFCQGVILCV